MNVMTKKLLYGEVIFIFKQQDRETVNETMDNYKTVMEGLTSHFFPPKALQLQKRYFYWGIFNPWDDKIYKLIYWVRDIVEYIDHFQPL